MAKFLLFSAAAVAIISIIGILLYLLQAFGLYKMGRKQGMENSWLAFIPILNLYVLGSIVSETKIGSLVIPKLGFVLPAAAVLTAALQKVGFLGGLAGLAMFVLYIVSIYGLFKLYTPESALIKTVVGTILPFILPILIFLIRDKEQVDHIRILPM